MSAIRDAPAKIGIRPSPPAIEVGLKSRKRDLKLSAKMAMEGIASSVADALVRHLATLPPRTLLLVLGDHGFCVDKRGHVSDGGASPEEVLVPCLAYLTADLH